MGLISGGRVFYDDEHIISFLFRMQLIHGIFDFSNLFHLNGKLRHNIQTPKSILDICREYDEYQFAYSFASHTDEEGIGWGPINFSRMTVGQFLDSGEVTIAKRNHNNLKIYYCKTCIQESIEKNGVGYLKKSWLMGGVCKIHNKKLLPLKQIPMPQMIDVLSDLLVSGIFTEDYPDDGGTVNVGEKRVNIDDENVYYSSNTFEPSFVYIKPCVKEYFAHWLCLHRRSLSRRYYKELRYKYAELLAVDLQENPVFFVPYLYSILMADQQCSFKEYVEKSTKIDTELVGIRNQRRIPLKVMKLCGVNCNRCPLPAVTADCRNYGKIAWFHLMSPVVKEIQSGIISTFTNRDTSRLQIYPRLNLQHCPFDLWWRRRVDVEIIGWIDSDIYYCWQRDVLSLQSTSLNSSEVLEDKRSYSLSLTRKNKEIEKFQRKVVFISRQNELIKNFLDTIYHSD